MNFEDLYQSRDQFRDEILRQIGDNLSGYVLEDAAIDYLEQTPLDKLDPHNIMDAQGIRKITELTAIEHIQTNQWQRDEQAKIKKKDVETQETLYELERQQAKRRRANCARCIRPGSRGGGGPCACNRKSAPGGTRPVAGRPADRRTAGERAARKGSGRTTASVPWRLRRARHPCPSVGDRRSREGGHPQTIDKDKAVEVQRRRLPTSSRERVIVERTVAEREEAIKEVRVVSEADRTRKSAVIEAEGKAEHDLVLQVKAAGPMSAAPASGHAGIDARRGETEGRRKTGRGEKREAEGIEAIGAAPGLANAKVQLANADATEKTGMVEARVKIADAEAVASLAPPKPRRCDSSSRRKPRASRSSVWQRFRSGRPMPRRSAQAGACRGRSRGSQNAGRGARPQGTNS